MRAKTGAAGNIHPQELFSAHLFVKIPGFTKAGGSSGGGFAGRAVEQAEGIPTRKFFRIHRSARAELPFKGKKP